MFRKPHAVCNFNLRPRSDPLAVVRGDFALSVGFVLQ